MLHDLEDNFDTVLDDLKVMLSFFSRIPFCDRSTEYRNVLHFRYQEAQRAHRILVDKLQAEADIPDAAVELAEVWEPILNKAFGLLYNPDDAQIPVPVTYVTETPLPRRARTLYDLDV